MQMGHYRLFLRNYTKVKLIESVKAYEKSELNISAHLESSIVP